MSTNGSFIWSFAFDNADGQARPRAWSKPPTAIFMERPVLADWMVLALSSEFRPMASSVISILFATCGATAHLRKGPYAQPGWISLWHTSTNGAGANGGTIFKMNTNGGAPVWSVALSNSTGCVPLADLFKRSMGPLRDRLPRWDRQRRHRFPSQHSGSFQQSLFFHRRHRWRHP